MLLTISMYGWKIRNSVLFVTITNVLVPAFYHSMIEKQKPSFRHGAHDFFKSSAPDDVKDEMCVRREGDSHHTVTIF